MFQVRPCIGYPAFMGYFRLSGLSGMLTKREGAGAGLYCGTWGCATYSGSVMVTLIPHVSEGSVNHGGPKYLVKDRDYSTSLH